MAKKNKTYKRLPGTGRTAFFVQTLWTGPDHLLVATSSGAEEKYKRFQYADIQSIVIRKTSRAAAWNVLLAALILLSVLLGIKTDPAVYVLPGFIGIFLLINLIRGPSSETWLQTAVQVQRLYSFNRMRQAQKNMDRLRRLIEQAQGSLDIDDLKIDLAGGELLGPPNQVPPEMREVRAPLYTPSYAPLSRPNKEFKNNIHWILFLCFLFLSVFSILDFFHSSLTKGIIGTTVFSLSFFLCIWALVRQADTMVYRGVKQATLFGLFVFIVSSILGNILGFMIRIEDPNPTRSYWELLVSLCEMSPWDSGFLFFFSLFTLFGFGIAGLWGVAALKKNDKLNLHLPKENPEPDANL